MSTPVTSQPPAELLPIADLWPEPHTAHQKRILGALRRQGIRQLGDLTQETGAGLLRYVRDFGVGSLERVREGLAAHGLHLKGES